MQQTFTGFDWDEANLEKCQKHGVSVAKIEGFARPHTVRVDVARSLAEERLKAIGRTDQGRYVFPGSRDPRAERERLIRPISARYMHAKEVAHYEEENADL